MNGLIINKSTSVSSSTALIFDGDSCSAEWSAWQVPIAPTLAMSTDDGIY